VALDHSIKPLLALTACLVLEGALEDASAVAQTALAAHGRRGLGGFALLWLGLISQCAGKPRAALSDYRSASTSDVMPIRQAALWGGALCAAVDDSCVDEVVWFTDRVLDETTRESTLSFQVVRETFMARSGSRAFAERIARIESALHGQRADLVNILHGS
jgi:hypothetical protein